MQKKKKNFLKSFENCEIKSKNFTAENKIPLMIRLEFF